MAETPRHSPTAAGSDPDGVRVVARDATAARRQLALQTLVLLFAGGCVGYALMPRPASAPPPRGGPPPVANPERFVIDSQAEGAPAHPPAVAASDAEGAPPVPAPASDRRALAARPRRDSSPSKEEPAEPREPLAEAILAAKESGKDVTMKDVIQALNDAGIHEGIGAFNPPGTSPPLEGLAVPEDYELPPGYVRHYQSTDDGQAIDPILMYSPDYEFFDDAGNPVAIPADRVVPPDQAPPGFPIRPIVIPPPREPGDLGR